MPGANPYLEVLPPDAAAKAREMGEYCLQNIDFNEWDEFFAGAMLHMENNNTLQIPESFQFFTARVQRKLKIKKTEFQII